MQVTRGRLYCLAVAGAGLLLLAGCSSSKNNAYNAAKANVATTTASVVSAAVTRTATPQLPINLTPSPVPAASPTATPAAASSTVRTPTPSTASSSGAAVAAGSGPADAALQQAFANAALKVSDLPAGFTTAGDPDTSLDLPGETAAYTGTYLSVALPNIGILADALLGFKDTATTQASFANIQQLLQQQDSSLNVKLTPVPTGAKIGDQTVAFGVSLSTQGFDLSGYLVAWRQGRLGGEILLAGTGGLAPSSVDSTVALAQKQAATVAAIKQ